MQTIYENGLAHAVKRRLSEAPEAADAASATKPAVYDYAQAGDEMLAGGYNTITCSFVKYHKITEGNYKGTQVPVCSITYPMFPGNLGKFNALRGKPQYVTRYFVPGGYPAPENGPGSWNKPSIAALSLNSSDAVSSVGGASVVFNDGGRIAAAIGDFIGLTSYTSGAVPKSTNKSVLNWRNSKKPMSNYSKGVRGDWSKYIPAEVRDVVVVK